MKNITDLSDARRARASAGLTPAEVQQQNLAKLRRIEKQIEKPVHGKKGWVFTKIDRLSAAKVVGQMIAQAKEFGSISDLTANFVGRIDRCSCDPEENIADRSVRQRLLQRPLVQKVGPYLKLAELLAKPRGQDPDQAKIAVLQNTSIWNVSSKSAPRRSNLSEAAEFLSLELNELAERVSRDCNIDDLQERLERIPAAFDRLRNTFVPSSGTLYRQSYARQYAAFEDNEAAFPSTYLCRLFHSEIRAQAFLHTETFEDPYSTNVMPFAREPWPHPGADASGTKLEIHIVIKRELRLAFGWSDSLERFQPLFETRGYVSAYLPHDNYITPNDLFPHLTVTLLQQNRPMLIRHDGSWRKLSLLCDGRELCEAIRDNTTLRKSGIDPVDWPIDPLDSYNTIHPDWAISWLPVTPEYVECLLGEPRHMRDDLDILEDPPLELSHEAFWFPGSTIGYTVEHAIQSGALRKSLVASVEQFSDALNVHEHNWRREAEAKTSAIIDDLRSDLRPAPFERPK